MAIKSLPVNNSALRCRPKAMDARRDPPPNAVHWARVATPQTRFGAATLRAGCAQIAPGAGLNYLRASSKETGAADVPATGLSGKIAASA